MSTRMFRVLIRRSFDIAAPDADTARRFIKTATDECIFDSTFIDASVKELPDSPPAHEGDAK